MNSLQKINFEGSEYFIDFRLQEIRLVNCPGISIKFSELSDKKLKEQIRIIRAIHSDPVFMEGLDN